jgi:hypothetical protein
MGLRLSQCHLFLARRKVRLNILERKEYRRILGIVFDNKKVNWGILTNKEIYAIVKNLT